MQVKKQQLELDMEQWTGSKLGKEEVHQDCILSPSLFNFYAKYIMRNAGLDEVQAGFRKGRGTRDQIPTSIGSSKKQESSRKTSISALLTMSKPLCGSQHTVDNSERDGNTRPPDLPPEKSVCRSTSNSWNWT